METTTLGRTGLNVSPIALGTWQLGGHWGAFREQDAIQAIRRARELGINVFDTAHAYGFGQAERILGAALKDELRTHREDIVLVTKGGLRIGEGGMPYPDSDPAWLREGIENSLRSLDVDHLDVFLVHAPDDNIPFADTAEFLAGFVDKGLIRHVGVSNFDAADATAFGVARPAEVAESRYNLFDRNIEESLLPYAAENELGVLSYSPLASGLLSGALDAGTQFAPDDWRAYMPMFRGEPLESAVAATNRLRNLAEADFGVPVAQLATAWALAHPAVTSVIVGTRRAEHVQDAVAAAGLRLGPAERAAVAAAVAPA